MKKFLYILALGVLSSSSVMAQESLIQTQPEGTLHDNMMRSGMGFYYALQATLPIDVSGMKSSIVIGNDGDIYIKNPFSQIRTNTWLQGTIDKDGNVTVHTPQYIYREIDGTKISDLYAVRMKESGIPNDYSFTKDEEESDLFFTWKDGKLTQVGGGILGLAEIDGTFYGYADKDIEMNPFTAQLVTPPNPDKLVFSDYIIGYSTNYEVPYAITAKLAIDGSDVWLKDFIRELPDAWLHGKYDNGNVTFESGQYLGLYDREYYAFFYGATKYVDKNYQGMDINMYRLENDLYCYENSRKGFTSDEVFLINSGNTISNYLDLYDNPVFDRYEDTARTPMTPTITAMQPPSSSDGLGIGMFSFALDPLDDKGMFLDPEKLYYTIYIESENNPLVLKASEFPGVFKSDTTEIPYNFDDTPTSMEWSLFSYFNEINLLYFNPDWQWLGVQAIYKGGGVDTKSPVVMPGSPIDSVEEIVDYKNMSRDYYDLTGRKVDNPSNGIYIVKYADGKIEKKVIH